MKVDRSLVAGPPRNSVKKYNQPEGRDTERNHPLNRIVGQVS